MTPLFCAVMNSHSHIVKSLIDHSADWWHKAPVSISVLDCALHLMFHRYFIASMLQNLDTTLHVAADRGDLDTVKVLMPLFWERRFELNDKGQTCLHKAVHKGHTKVMRYLIDQCGFDPNLKDAVSSWPFIVRSVSDSVDGQTLSTSYLSLYSRIILCA